jgi:hypothetical protein
MLHPLERLKSARAQVAEAHSLMLRPTGGNLEACGRLLEEARDLLGGMAPGGLPERADAAALAAELAISGALARQAATLWLECVRLGATGARDYAPGGAAAVPAGRLLAEI